MTSLNITDLPVKPTNLQPTLACRSRCLMACAEVAESSPHKFTKMDEEFAEFEKELAELGDLSSDDESEAPATQQPAHKATAPAPAPAPAPTPVTIVSQPAVISRVAENIAAAGPAVAPAAQQLRTSTHPGAGVAAAHSGAVATADGAGPGAAVAAGPVLPGASRPGVPHAGEKRSRALRTGAGKVWVDESMQDWPDNDFRIFVSNLTQEVTDEMLWRAFNEFESLAKVRVCAGWLAGWLAGWACSQMTRPDLVSRPQVLKNYEGKCKGIGFVSFIDHRQGLKAMRAKQGAWIGSRPCKLQRSTQQQRSMADMTQKDKRKQAKYSKYLKYADKDAASSLAR